MRMPRLFWKLFFALWLSIMGFAVIMSVVNNTLNRADTTNGPSSRMERDINGLAERLATVLRTHGEQGGQKFLQNLPQQFRNRVYVFAKDDHELLGREVIRKRLESTKIQATYRELKVGPDETYQLLVLQRIPRGALLEPGQRGIFFRLLFAAFVSALLSIMLARYLAAPLADLSKASRSLGKGDLSTRIGPRLTKRKDEFGMLASDFDEMAARLQDSRKANHRLLRDVSHELRSPLARLRVALEIARNRDSSAVSGELDRIELESERLEILVDEVLGLLRESSLSNPLKLENFDLVELLTDIREVVRYEIPEELPGMLLNAPDPIMVNADRELLWRAFENLVRNALIHTDDISGVEVEATMNKKTQTIDIFVRDRGPGISPQHLDQIFKPFYRVQEARDRKSGGHGLGLAIAEAAVKRHAGSISAANRESGGLEIHVSLPG
ncbi:MAG: two-component system sensor histidine kinase CpxA [Lysobacterales bacterium]|jgi:two-component system sensor histidine kinase CpxA